MSLADTSPIPLPVSLAPAGLSRSFGEAEDPAVPPVLQVDAPGLPRWASVPCLLEGPQPDRAAGGVVKTYLVKTYLVKTYLVKTYLVKTYLVKTYLVKTYLVRKAALQPSLVHRERCAVVTYTNAQSIDIARGLAKERPDATGDPAAEGGQSGAGRTDRTREAPARPEVGRRPCLGITVGNATMWASYDVRKHGEYDLMILDDAYQVSDLRFLRNAGCASRYFLIGDSDQIEAFTAADMCRWGVARTGRRLPVPPR